MQESTEKLLNETYKVLKEAAEEDDSLAVRIGGTESLTCYEISGKHLEEIKWELDKSGINYFSTPAKSLILVSRDEKTLKRCRMVERKSLQRKGGYAVEMDYEDLAASIAGKDDKQIPKKDAISKIDLIGAYSQMNGSLGLKATFHYSFMEEGRKKEIEEALVKGDQNRNLS